MGYTEEALIINALGDEWGGGELWDLYEAVTNSDKFFSILPYVVAAVIAVVGIIFFALYFALSDKKQAFLILGIGCFLGGIAVLVASRYL